METYIRVAENLLTPGYVMTTIYNDNAIVTDNCIAINVNTWLSCPAENELRNTLMKRLEGKRRGNITQLSAIAVCILCSRGYVVNHISMSGVSESDMKTVWGFIETSMICSSTTLSTWMSTAVAGRSQDGYCASIDSADDNDIVISGNHRQRKASTILKPMGKTRPINANVVSLEYKAGCKIMDLVVTDSIMLQRLRFNDGLPPPLHIGPTWSTTERKDSHTDQLQ